MQSSTKKWQPYLSRAQELEARLPLISYYCRLFVVDSIMKARADPTYDVALDNLFGACEQMKPQLQSQLEDGEGKMEEFALGIFANCDKADRESPVQPPDVSLAGRFYISALFFDVLTQFYSDRTLPPDLEEKRRYAKYRTIQIRNGKPLDQTPENPPIASSNAPLESLPIVPEIKAMPKASQPNSTGFKYAESSGEDSSPPLAPTPAPKGPAAPRPVAQPLSRIDEESTATPSVSRGDATNAKKKLQQAISAIDFADYPTAGKLCTEALSLLSDSRT